MCVLITAARRHRRLCSPLHVGAAVQKIQRIRRNRHIHTTLLFCSDYRICFRSYRSSKFDLISGASARGNLERRRLSFTLAIGVVIIAKTSLCTLVVKKPRNFLATAIEQPLCHARDLLIVLQAIN
jgi:hypothetical protein